MKKMILIYSFLCLFLNIQAQDQQEALNSFKTIVNRFNEFFSTPQKMIYKDYRDAEFKSINVEIIECSASNISYDVKKTESIVSPFSAVIHINFRTVKNSICGNIFMGKKNHQVCLGYDSEAGALENNKAECFKSQFVDNYNWGESSYIIDFYFAYQDDKWNFKPVEMYIIGT